MENQEAPRLNEQIWTPRRELQPGIRNSLLQIAYDFAHKHNILPAAIVDIVLTGSLCGYHWTDFSDVDLHIIVDFDQIDAEDYLAKDYYDTAKTLWNEVHDIKVCDRDVEIYVQDKNEPHQTPGIYSLVKDAWVKMSRPETQAQPDEGQIDRKSNKISRRIDDLAELVKTRRWSEAIIYANELKTYITQMRKVGLKSVGENSIENLAFKNLRNRGELERLSELKTQAYDKQKSIQNCH
jgi:hypothetical protein